MSSQVSRGGGGGVPAPENFDDPVMKNFLPPLLPEQTKFVIGEINNSDIPTVLVRVYGTYSYSYSY